MSPTVTLAEAARRSRCSEATLRRRLKAGQLDATRNDDGSWSIPIAALVEAGLLDRVTPTEQPSAPPPPSEIEAELRQRLVEAEKRAAVAEALADERAKVLDDLRSALALANRMLDTGPLTKADVPTVASKPAEQAPARRRWYSRIGATR